MFNNWIKGDDDVNWQAKTKLAVDVDVLVNEKHYGGIAYYIDGIQRALNTKVDFITSNIKYDIPYLSNVMHLSKASLSNYKSYLNTNLVIWPKLFSQLKKYNVRVYTLIYDLMIFHKDHEAYKSFNDETRNIMMTMYKNANAIITISESIKNEIHEMFSIPLNNIYVAYPGIDPIFTYKNDIIKQDYILTNYAPNSSIFLQELDTNIHQAGNINEQHINYMQLHLQSHYTHLGFLERQSLQNVYNEQLQFYSNQKYEGFDMQPIEQLSCHTKVLQSHSNVHDEILKEFDNVLFYEDYSIKDVKNWLYTKSSFEEDDKRLKKYTFENQAKVIEKVIN